MQLSTIKHDYLLYQAPYDRSFCSGQIINRDINAIDIVDYVTKYKDRLTDDYGWIVVGAADSYEELQSKYPEFYI